MMDDSHVAVIIPVIDEERALPHVLADLRRVHAGPIFVVDGGSQDQSVAVARGLGATVIAEAQRGYGRACLTGAEQAIRGGAEIIAFLDGDYSDDPTELPLLLAPIKRGAADVVIGARVRRKRSTGAMALHQQWGNTLIAALLRVLYGVAVGDPGPFRAVRAPVFTALRLQEMTYGWPVEAIARAARLGYRVRAVPVSYRPRIGTSKISGTVRGSVGAAYRLLYAVLRYL